MNDLWSNLDWEEGSSSIEPWELSEVENPEISLVHLQHFLMSLEDNPIRCEEHEQLFAMRPQFIKANQDTWNKFFLRIPKMDEGKDFQAEKDAVEKPRTYEIQPYLASRPVFEDIEKEVIKEASTAVKTSKFWLVKSLRDDYVGEKTYPRYHNALQQWESDKAAFEEQQLAAQAEFNKKEQDLYNAKLREIEAREQAYLHPSPLGVQKQIQKDLGEISLPYAISIAFSFSSGNVFMDILYPDRTELLSSEYISIPKTQTEENLRYIEIILGCAYMIAMTVFNASKAIQNLTIVGHSVNYSSVDEKTDSNLYAVCFNRITFSQDFAVRRFFSPYERLMHYPQILDVSKRYIISPIRVKPSKGEKHIEYDAMSFTTVTIPASEQQEIEGIRPINKLDDRFENAAKMVMTMQRVTTSDLQRRLGMGFVKASYVLNQLELAGIVGPQDREWVRPVYVTSMYELDGIIKSMK